jgi:hypothetical protein
MAVAQTAKRDEPNAQNQTRGSPPIGGLLYAQPLQGHRRVCGGKPRLGAADLSPQRKVCRTNCIDRATAQHPPIMAGAVLYSPCVQYGEGGNQMHTESDVYRYRETLTHHREKAKQTIASAETGSDERGEAVKLFFRCDGAIQILSWVLELEADTGFNLPPNIEQRDMGN